MTFATDLRRASRAMSKKSKKAGRVTRKSSFSNLNISKIGQHKIEGRKLRPPLNTIPAATPSSWADDHMPEMLWAVFLTGVLERKDYLACFRSIAVLCRDWFKR